MATTEKPKRASKRERLDAAYRVRAGAIGLLTCCRCTYPLEQHATATRHNEACPAHEMTLSAMRTGNHHALTFTPSAIPPTTTKRTRTK